MNKFGIFGISFFKTGIIISFLLSLYLRFRTEVPFSNSISREFSFHFLNVKLDKSSLFDKDLLCLMNLKTSDSIRGLSKILTSVCNALLLFLVILKKVIPSKPAKGELFESFLSKTI